MEMYQVAEFSLNRRIKPVPVIWTFKEKGRLQCYWPKRDVTNKLKKRVPPPMVRNSKSWDILEIKLLLNGKMFDNLISAESDSQKIAEALLSSGNSSTIDGSGSKDSSWTTVTLSSEESSMSPAAVTFSAKQSSNGMKLCAEKKPFLEEVLASGNSSSFESNGIVESNFIRINSLISFKDQELLLTNENNMKRFADYWLEKKEADEGKFIEEMVFHTFEREYFISNVSFKKDEAEICLADSNILRCWIYIVGKKFGQKIIFEKIVESTSNIRNIETAHFCKDMSAIQLLDQSVEAKVSVIDPDRHFTIASPERFKMVEVLLLHESNIEILSDSWVLICQNKINLFVQQMISKTFETGFLLKSTTFKVGEPNRELLEGSNILKCWTVAAQKKFPDKEVSEAIIQKHYRTYKNTLGKKNNPVAPQSS